METLSDMVETVLGLSGDGVGTAQIFARCTVSYAAALAMVRIGDKRFLGKLTAFDVVLAVMLGSVVSRAITDGTSVIGKVTAGAFLVLLHLAMSKAAFRWSRFGTLVKGSPRVLVRDGQIDWDAMRKASITEQDLVGLLRTEASSLDLARVQVAHLERSGDVSFIMRDQG